jgi:serine/threonine protein kinase
MPDNSWITPYKFLPETGLSIGPSQGIVYKLSDNGVVKVPFQYPVKASDEADEQIYMSLRSMALCRREGAFYDLLAKNPHPNLAKRIQINPQAFASQTYGLVLEYFNPLRRVWSDPSRANHVIWIQQLLGALEWLEELGYTHGDLKTDNLGIDKDNNLRLFDFGSITHCQEEGFIHQVIEDHFTLATCIHYLASGIDPFANVKSYVEVKQTLDTLKKGKGVAHPAANSFEEVIQAGWTGTTASNFSQLRRSVALATGQYPSQPSDHNLERRDQGEMGLEVAPDDHDAGSLSEKQSNWMDEQEYRAAWKAMGYEVPDDI